MEGHPTAIPPVPLALEGSAILHQMFRVRWADWKAVSARAQNEILDDAVQTFTPMEANGSAQTGLFSLLGHKGDLMLVHFRPTFDAVNEAELRVARLGLSDFLEPTTSYVSVVELGLYEASIHLYRSLAEQGLQPDTAEWRASVEKELAQKREAMSSRVWPSIPARRYLSFYPMDKKRGEEKNWYQLPIAARQQMMRAHGIIGRRYAGQVTRYSGSMASTTGSGGWTFLPTIPWCSKNSSMRCALTRPAPRMGCLGRFISGCVSRPQSSAAC